MSLLNIGGDQADEFYRYQMEKLRVKEEGRGNGIKTSFPNMVEVAKALKRPPTYITKFIGCELGAQSKSDEKQRYYMVTGTHTEAVIGDLVDKFVKLFVLCDSCHLPETDMRVKPKSKSISLLCTACGHKTRVDTTHKLCSFVFKNPPSDSLKQKAGSGAVKGVPEESEGKKDKKGKKGKGKKGEEKDNETEVPSPSRKDKKKSKEEQVAEVDEELFAAAAQIDVNEDEEVEWQTDISAEAAEKRRQELLGDMSEKALSDLAGVKKKGPTEEEIAAEKAKEEEEARIEAERKRKEEEEKAAKEEAERKKKEAEAEPTHEVPAEEMLEYLGTFITENLDNPKRAAREFSRVCAQHGLEGSKKVRLIVGSTFGDLYFTDAAKIGKVIHAAVGQGDMKQQRTVVNTIERLVATEHTAMIPKFAALLQALYEADIAEEEAIVKWYEEPKNKDVSKKDQKEIRAKSKVFIEWLQEAETESESD